MNTLELIESISEFKSDKNIDRVKMMNILEEVFRSTIIKKYGADENFDIIINTDKGDIDIIRNRIIVKDGKLENENEEIEYSEAIKIEPDFEIGEEISEEVKLQDFGRRNIQALKQHFLVKLNEVEKDSIYNLYKERVGEIVTGEVHQIWKKEILILDDEGNELILPKNEQIPSDYYRKGENLRAVVKSVELKNNIPVVILSRTSPTFLERLFELEVPEIFDGLITIKDIVREPGERAKVAVESYDDRVDPVGACVGMKGSRIRGIVRELRNENIDVINFTKNPELYITRSITPAKITSISINENSKIANVFLKSDQISLAIGKGGNNIKLASRLTGFEIDVYRDKVDQVDDVDLDEFVDEIDTWIIDEIKAIGLDTAKNVLELTKEELVERTDLEEETIEEVIKILKSEFE